MSKKDNENHEPIYNVKQNNGNHKANIASAVLNMGRMSKHANMENSKKKRIGSNKSFLESANTYNHFILGLKGNFFYTYK